MASTAEELNAQSEQLQTTIGFFKLNGQVDADHRQSNPPVARTRVKAPAASPRKELKTPPAKGSAGKGLLLDMDAGRDKLDNEFEKF